MESIKNIGLPSKEAPESGENHFMQFDDKQNANTFRNFYANLYSNLDLVEKSPAAKISFRGNFVKKYYSAMNIPSISLNLDILSVKRSIRY